MSLSSVTMLASAEDLDDLLTSDTVTSSMG